MRISIGRSRHAFTIVELLVVIAVIGVLVGLLLPALGGVQRRSKKADETSRIRQVGIGWTLYANGNDDHALPGYLEDDVLDLWRVKYRLPNDDRVRDADAGPWPWRLMPYLDYDTNTLMAHARLEDQSAVAMSDYDLEDPDFPFDPPGWIRPDIARPSHIAMEPGFSYNALYVGGWFKEVEIEYELESGDLRTETVARPRFWNARQDDDETVRVAPVAFSPGVIRNPSKLTLFTTAAPFRPGEHSIEVIDIYPGSHFAVPPTVALENIWKKGSGTDILLEVLSAYDGNATPVPVGRYTGQASVLHADLHCESYLPGVLTDQRFWINIADEPRFRHTDDVDTE